MAAPIAQPARRKLESVIDDASLGISMSKGTTGRAVISFSGIGVARRGDRRVQSGEFGRTLAAAGAGDATLIFVIDRSQRWLNTTGPQIVDVLNRSIEGHHAVFTIGNSMGGFAAFWSAGQLARCRRSIAFAPQFSMHPEQIAFETRWAALRKNMVPHNILHVFEKASADVEYWAFFGGRGKDRLHARLMTDSGIPTLKVIIADEAGHGVVRVMQEKGALVTAVRMLLRDADPSVAELEATLAPLMTGSGRPARKPTRRRRTTIEPQPGRNVAGNVSPDATLACGPECRTGPHEPGSGIA